MQMQATQIALDQLFQLRTEGVVILDVRSASEYRKGHILGAINLPILNDEERANIGTCYAQQGREEATALGFQLVGPRLYGILNEAKELAPTRKVIVYCWRGGMRSASMAWMLQFAGFQVHILEGGYAAYHNALYNIYSIQNYQINVLGGPTGCGKGAVLNALHNLGEQVIDLEQMAGHRGSVFGALPQGQPSNEQFYNIVGEAFRLCNNKRPIWIEGESAMIGHIALPQLLYRAMQQAPFYYYELSKELRLQRIVTEYGGMGTEFLLKAFEIIRKRIGNDRYKVALTALEQGDLHQAADIAMQYYDKAYSKHLPDQWQKPVKRMVMEEDNPTKVARMLQDFVTP